MMNVQPYTLYLTILPCHFGSKMKKESIDIYETRIMLTLFYEAISNFLKPIPLSMLIWFSFQFSIRKLFNCIIYVLYIYVQGFRKYQL